MLLHGDEIGEKERKKLDRKMRFLQGDEMGVKERKRTKR